MYNKKPVFEEYHGSSNFPAIVCFNSSKSYKDIVYLNWHTDIEFIYVAEGVLSLQIDLNHYVLNKGEAAIVNSRELHYGNAADGFECDQYGILFNPAMLGFDSSDICQSQYIKPFIDGSYRLPGIIKGIEPWEKEIIKHMENLITVYNQGGFGFELKFKSILYSIFSEVLINRAYTTNEKPLPTQKKYKIQNLKKVLNYIEDNINQKISVSVLAKELNMTEDNFYKFFKSITGKTPIGYINSYRIRIAEGVLLDKSLSISEVAMSVGFDNISYFIKTFKSLKNSTPGEYRKKFDQHQRQTHHTQVEDLV